MVPLSLSDLQVDAGGSGYINHASDFQLQCFVLLLLCHGLLRTLVTDIPPQRLGLSPNTGTPDVTSHRVLANCLHFIQPTADEKVSFFLKTLCPLWMMSSLCFYVLICSGPEWFGSLHHVDLHRLSDQLLIGSPPVGCGQEHSSNGFSVHPVWRGDGMVSSDWTRLNDGHFRERLADKCSF